MQRGAYHDDHIDIIHNCSTMKEAGTRGKQIAEAQKNAINNDNKTQWTLIGIGLCLSLVQNSLFGGLRVEEILLILFVFIGLFVLFKK